jgi:hypothetical protein
MKKSKLFLVGILLAVMSFSLAEIVSNRDANASAFCYGLTSSGGLLPGFTCAQLAPLYGPYVCTPNDACINAYLNACYSGKARPKCNE